MYIPTASWFSVHSIGNTTNDKKELERLAIENVERRMSFENERNTPNGK